MSSWVQAVAQLLLDSGASATTAPLWASLLLWVGPALLLMLALGGLEAWAARLRRTSRAHPAARN